MLWVVNLGCIDLNQWYSRCDDVDRPDYLHSDLDPGPGAPFAQVLESALLVREALDVLKLPSWPKLSGSKGLHIYVLLARGPRQKDVWTFAKALAMTLAERHPPILTAEYRVARRPKDECSSITTRMPVAHARKRLLCSAHQRGKRVDARHVGRGRTRDHIRAIYDGRRAAARGATWRSVCAHAGR